MSTKLKVLGLTVVAALAVSAVASMSASATGSGHFVTPGVTHSVIEGDLEGSNNRFTDPSLPAVTCKTGHWEITTTTETSEEVTIRPTFTECSTSAGEAHVNMNGCHYTATIETHAETTLNQLHLTCGTSITNHVTIRATNFAGSCTITIPEQTATSGARYTTGGTEGSGHDITADIIASGITSTAHAHGFGACLFVDTHRTGGGMTGEMTVKAKDTAGNPVGLTATGSTGA